VELLLLRAFLLDLWDFGGLLQFLLLSALVEHFVNKVRSACASFIGLGRSISLLRLLILFFIVGLLVIRLGV